MVKGIYKRGNIFWIRYAGLDGEVIYESSGSTKFKVAETLLIQRRQSIKEGKQPETKRIANFMFNELADHYEKWINGRQASAKIKGYIIGGLRQRFGNIPLRRFNTVLVEQLQTELIGRGCKNGYTNKILSVLKHMFSKAVEWDMVESETLKRIRKVKHLREDRRLRYLESKEECQALINACDPHLRPIVITALNTGLRKGNVLNLKWSNIDLRNGFILIDMTKNGERLEMPINETLRKTLLDIPRRLDGGYVFHDPITDRPYQDVRDSFTSACRRAGIRDFHFHDLRHTFASHLIMAGVDLTTVSRLLGHKDIKMTLRYAHLAPHHTKGAVDILDSIIGNISNEMPTIQKLYNQGVTN